MSKSIQCSLVLMLALFASGCVSQRAEVQPFKPPGWHVESTTIGVIAEEQLPPLLYTLPMTRKEATKHFVSRGFKSGAAPLQAAGKVAEAGAGAGEGAVLLALPMGALAGMGVVFSGVGTVFGAAFGPLSGVSEAKRTKAEATLTNALPELKVHETLGHQVLATARARTPLSFTLFSTPSSPPANDTPADLSSTNSAIQELIRLYISDIRLVGGTNSNPSLRLSMSALAVVENPATKERLDSCSTEFTSTNSFTFIGWARNDARRLRQQLQTGCQIIADKFVNDLLLEPTLQAKQAEAPPRTGRVRSKKSAPDS